MIITRKHERGVPYACAAALLTVSLLTGCASAPRVEAPANTQNATVDTEEQDRKEAVAATNEILKAFADGSMEFDASEIESLEQLESFGVDPRELVDHLCGRFSYDVKDVQVDGYDAVARVEITFVDVDAAITAAEEQAVQEEAVTSLGELYSEGNINALMQGLYDLVLGQIDACDVTNTEELEIDLVKDGQGWHVDEGSIEELVSLMLGGIDLSAYAMPL